MARAYRNPLIDARGNSAMQRGAAAREEKRRREVKEALHQLQQLWGAGQQHECSAVDSHASKDALARGADC